MQQNVKDRTKTVKPRQSPWEPPLVVLDIPEQSASLFNGIVRQTREYGWRVIDLSITRQTVLPGIHPAGLLGHGSVDHPLVHRLREQGVQAVRVGNFPHPLDGSGVPAILSDLTIAGELAAEHFAKRQFKNVAFVGNYPWLKLPVCTMRSTNVPGNWGAPVISFKSNRIQTGTALGKRGIGIACNRSGTGWSNYPSP